LTGYQSGSPAQDFSRVWRISFVGNFVELPIGPIAQFFGAGQGAGLVPN